MTIRAIIWDLGGVLVRTEDFTNRENLAKRLGMTRTDLEHLVFSDESGGRAQRGEISIEEHWDNLGQTLNLSQEEMKDFQTDFWGGDGLDTELVDYIRSLRQRYKTGLLSNAFPDLRHYITYVWKFDDAFDEMIISAEVGVMKPDPRIYHLALERLEVAPSEAVFIDDFRHNVEGARSVNMYAIHFHNPTQARTELEGLLNPE